MDFLNALKSVVISIKDWVNEKLKKKVDVVEGKGLSTNDLTDDLLVKINSFDESIAAAKKVGDDAQTEVDALETKVGDIPDGFKATTVIGYINEKTANTTSDSTIQELVDRVTELEKQVSGNLLKAPLTVENETGDGKIIALDYSLGLEVGKTYKVSVTFGKDNTVLDTTIKYKDVGGGMNCLEWFYPSITDSRAYFYLYDKLSMDADEEPVFNENGATFVAGAEEAYVPLTLNSITLVEEASNGNLLSTPITHNEPIDDTAVINLDFAVGIEDGKSYTFKGTHGTNNTPFEVTALADKANGGDFAGMLTDERQSLIVAEVRTAEGAGMDIVLLDKIHLDFENEISEYNENKAMVLLVTYSSAEQMIPFTINNITEAQVEYATKEEFETLGERVDNLELLHQDPLVATFNITTASTAITVKNLTGATMVDWGDGSELEDISAVKSYPHTYEATGTFEARFYGVITKVDTNAFYNNTNLRSIYIPNTITAIGDRSFEGCTNLNFVEFAYDSRLSSIGGWAFYNCKKLYSINIPKTTTNIYTYAFYTCERLRYIELPILSERGVGSYAFCNCSSITSLELPPDLKLIDNFSFSYMNGLKQLIIPEGIAEIKSNGFSYLYGLEEVHIYYGSQHGLSKPGIILSAQAFNGSYNLRKVIFDKRNVESLDYTITLKGKIFTDKGTNYSNDRVLEIRSDTPPTIVGIEYIQDDIKIIVPKSSLELYKNAEGWKDKASQIDCGITANDVYALVGNINTELANIIEGEGV